MKRRTLSPATAGFTMVELMVSMTISLVLLGGALSILYSSKLTSAQNEHMARIQEAGRTAFELIMRDARAAGFVGCARAQVDNSTTPPTSTFSNGLTSATLLWNFAQSVQGFEATSATVWTPALDAAIPASPVPQGGSDVLVLRTAQPDAPLFRTNVAANPVSADLSVDRDPTQGLTGPYAFPIPVVVTDCQFQTVVMATGFTGTAGTATIQHGTGGAGVTNTSANLPHAFTAGAIVQPVQTVVYYIASCTAAVTAACPGGVATPPALWQIVGSKAPQELIQGVESLQVKYGVDTNSDLLADQYVTADNVTNWGSVVSINISVLVRSVDEWGTTKDTRTYHLLGGAAAGGADIGPFNDRRQRAVYTTAITLRNNTL
jgi:type IV pilus assembly protein PilW